jgi:lipopolysaccharide/colanic/teichoic acid biosynthesis glycosyltransferase
MGLDGELFTMWKFRTMKPGPAQPGWTIANDPRRTPVGTFLRRTSLDELPQLWNVFVGEMSLVGPRPEQPFFVEKFRQEIPAYMLRHKVKAGITGWAQVMGWRGDTPLKERIECDLYYIRHWSIALDFKILFLTVKNGIIHDNAY